MIATLVLLAEAARALTLVDAVAQAVARQPQLRQAEAQTRVMRARADEQRAALLPQLNLTATYQRTTANFAPRPGLLPNSMGGTNTPPQSPSLDTFNYFNFGLTASQYLWDFGLTTGRWQAARATAEAQASTEQATRLQVILNVRAAYFLAWAQRALVLVAQANLANQRRHEEQIKGFVEVGTRPAIDLASADTAVANAEVQLIQAQNNYEVAKVQLNQAMGVEGPTDYEVGGEQLPPVDGEEADVEKLVDEAARARPDLVGLERSIRAAELSLRAAKGAYGPSLFGSMGGTEAGTDVTNLVWNVNFTLTLNWGLFQGLLTYSQVQEAHANLLSVEAQRDVLRQQVRVEVEQARLAVRAAKATLAATERALTSASEQLRLAEGRYQEGVGNVIELGDAQLTAAQASANRVSAEYQLSTARAQLEKALGRAP